jgi:hypothetical protein
MIEAHPAHSTGSPADGSGREPDGQARFVRAQRAAKWIAPMYLLMSAVQGPDRLSRGGLVSALGPYLKRKKPNLSSL